MMQRFNIRYTIVVRRRTVIESRSNVNCTHAGIDLFQFRTIGSGVTSEMKRFDLNQVSWLKDRVLASVFLFEETNDITSRRPLIFWLVHSAFNLLDTINSLAGCAGSVSRSLKSMASCAILDECMALDEATDGPVCSPATTDAYVTGIELNFGNIGGSKSKSSVSKGVLYRPNL